MFLGSVLRFVQITVVLIWPILKWIVSIEVFFQFIRMIYHWNTPDIYAGWVFLLHFSILIFLTYFVSTYEPKGL
ncbi:KleE stable inheritance protein [Neisseriaceae bacterium ESL0693]|nr:KleE stable inheritance protein [Neisseriaceae bacterium ESL0693]